MSNHCCSYMLNDVLVMLEEDSYFADIGPEMTLKFVRRIIELAQRNDGNPGEVLKDIGQRLRICYTCLQYRDDIDYGRCTQCSAKYQRSQG